MSRSRFSKMYLVSETEHEHLNRLQKRRSKRSASAAVAAGTTDAHVLTDSLKAVSKRRKRDAIASSVPRNRLRKYVSGVGVPQMTDAQVSKPLRRQQLVPRVPSPASPPSPFTSPESSQFETPVLQPRQTRSKTTAGQQQQLVRYDV